jgi:glutathione-regulated potassium-efflux system protein KefB
MAVGMSLDLSVVAANWRLVVVYVLAYKVVKAIGVYIVARLLKSDHRESIERAVLMSQGGEFGFVLYSSAMAVGIIDGEANAILTAIIIMSMVLTPLTMPILRRLTREEDVSLDGVDVVEELNGSVLLIGFGRFGQITSQPLLLRGVDVSIIDNNVDMIQAAATFGFKVYYGDGARLDILHAAGAGRAQAVLVCVDKGDVAVRITELLKTHFPLVPVLVRAYDRGAGLALVAAGADYQLRETLESAFTFGQKTLETLGINPEEARELIEDVRRRDEARFEAQLTGGLQAGRGFMKGNMPEPVPTPLLPPRNTGKAMNEETLVALDEALAEGDTEGA